MKPNFNLILNPIAEIALKAVIAFLESLLWKQRRPAITGGTVSFACRKDGSVVYLPDAVHAKEDVSECVIVTGNLVANDDAIHIKNITGPGVEAISPAPVPTPLPQQGVQPGDDAKPKKEKKKKRPAKEPVNNVVARIDAAATKEEAKAAAGKDKRKTVVAALKNKLKSLK